METHLVSMTELAEFGPTPGQTHSANLWILNDFLISALFLVLLHNWSGIDNSNLATSGGNVDMS